MDPEKAKIKPPTTYKEQVEILKNRNLLIENPLNAEKTLQRINYYRLTAYGLTLKDTFHTDEYINGATFSKILSLYEFDRRLRLLLMGALETIEIAMRTNISYEMAHKFGSLGYKDKENFINEKYHHDFLNELENLIIRSRKGELFIEHHFKHYAGEIPIWAAIEITSFGLISKLYRNLDEELKKHIAKTYYNVPYFYLESWLQTLANVRNICAHYGRLYNKKLKFKPRLFREELTHFDNQQIFAAIYITERLLNKTEGLRFITDLDVLILEYEDVIDFLHIGFPLNWRELLTNLNNKRA